MQLRELLNLCQDAHSDDWLLIPGGRPATTMIAGLFDPGMKDARMRPLVGHSIAVYEPDVRLSLAWPIPDEHEAERPDHLERFIPEWAEQDSHNWKNAKGRFAVVLFSGAPVWQEPVWYLDWGSGVGGYVADIRAVFGDPGNGGPSIERWETTAWAVSLARLINSFSSTTDWYSLDPTPRVVPDPTQIHPIDAARAGG